MKCSLIADMIVAEDKGQPSIDKHTLKRISKLNKRFRNVKTGKIKQIMEKLKDDSI